MRELLKYNDGTEIVHFVGVGQKDFALCGQDLAGDDEMGWSSSTETKLKVNCKNCIEIVEYCKSINRNEWI